MACGGCMKIRNALKSVVRVIPSRRLPPNPQNERVVTRIGKHTILVRHPVERK